MVPCSMGIELPKPLYDERREHGKATEDVANEQGRPAYLVVVADVVAVPAACILDQGRSAQIKHTCK